MSKQVSLDLRGERLVAIWPRLPERARCAVIEEYARLIARVAQDRSNDPDRRERPEIPRTGKDHEQT